jgi:seryl-tRNA synthetase
MLDRREIRQNPDAVRAAVRVKGIDLDVDELLQLDKASRELQHELDQKQALRKSRVRDPAPDPARPARGDD